MKIRTTEAISYVITIVCRWLFNYTLSRWVVPLALDFPPPPFFLVRIKCEAGVSCKDEGKR